MQSEMHRAAVFNHMKNDSLFISYAGIPLHTNEDDYAPFEVSSNFYWLTGSQYEKQTLVLIKTADKTIEKLFIEPADPFSERWTGHMPDKDEMNEITGIDEENIGYIDEMPGFIARQIDYMNLQSAYLDTYQYDEDDLMDYNHRKALSFQKQYPHIRIRSLRSLTGPLRKIKDEDEIDDIRHAIAITGQALKDMLTRLKPGMKEYQAQAVFEASCKYQGAERFAFPTIAGAGINACSMHYTANNDEIRDGSLVLFDLGAKYNNYCSDISRTYPANGTYTERQREIYNIVLQANQAVKAAAKPGLTLKDLNETAKKVLGEGLIRIGMIHDIAEVGQYYMHGVSHFIGIDCHDIMVGNNLLEPGCVISDEPGLYLDEEEIGIRIEDDLLITEDGCECLSEDIMRRPEEIEAYMRNFR